MKYCKYYFAFEDDNLYLRTQKWTDEGCIGIKDELVISKEAFIECYNKWIAADQPEESSN